MITSCDHCNKIILFNRGGHRVDVDYSPITIKGCAVRLAEKQCVVIPENGEFSEAVGIYHPSWYCESCYLNRIFIQEEILSILAQPIINEWKVESETLRRCADCKYGDKTKDRFCPLCDRCQSCTFKNNNKSCTRCNTYQLLNDPNQQSHHKFTTNGEKLYLE